jgi:hypothetical protein
MKLKGQFALFIFYVETCAWNFFRNFFSKLSIVVQELKRYIAGHSC